MKTILINLINFISSSVNKVVQHSLFNKMPHTHLDEKGLPYSEPYPWGLEYVNIDYIIEGVNVFKPRISSFFLKYSVIGIEYMSFYFYMFENYPKFKFTLWLIKNTKMGTLRYLYQGEVLSIRTFLVFKNIIIFSETYEKSKLNPFLLSKLSASITADISSKSGGFYSSSLPPTSVTFDVLVFIPVNPDDWELEDKWEILPSIIYYI